MPFETFGVLPKPSHRNHVVNCRYASRIPGISFPQSPGRTTGSQKIGNGQNSYGKLFYERYSFERMSENVFVTARDQVRSRCRETFVARQ